MIAITPIPAFSDNYLWLLDNGSEAIVVDPGDADAVTQYLNDHELHLAGILVTHHHSDHTGGILALKSKYQCPVWGPEHDSISHLDYPCQQNDSFKIPGVEIEVQVLSTPGHTMGHIAYFIPQSMNNPNALFCGDTLFSGGCGRLFEGTAEQMWQSMQKLMLLPGNTQVYPAHEYTLSNLKFALEVEPENKALINYYNKVKSLRAEGIPSLPSSLDLEISINPFMRVEQKEVIQAAISHSGTQLKGGSEVFAVIRRWKDNF